MKRKNCFKNRVGDAGGEDLHTNVVSNFTTWGMRSERIPPIVKLYIQQFMVWCTQVETMQRNATQ